MSVLHGTYYPKELLTVYFQFKCIFSGKSRCKKFPDYTITQLFVTKCLQAEKHVQVKETREGQKGREEEHRKLSPVSPRRTESLRLLPTTATPAPSPMADSEEEARKHYLLND